MSSESQSYADKEAKFFEDQRCLHDIINGFSECSHSLLDLDDTRPSFFIKHSTMLDIGDLSIKNKHYNEVGRHKGLKTEKEMVQILIDTNNWSEESEKKYKHLNLQVDNLEKTKNQIFLDSQRSIIKKKLEETQKSLHEIEQERESLIGLSLEQYVSNRTNTYSLWQCMYKDTELKTRLTDSFEEFYNFEAEQVDLYQLLFNMRMGYFTDDRLKRVAVNANFMNSYSLSKGRPLEFYGKIAVELTNYQLATLNYAGGFCNVLENAERKLPDTDDCDEIIKWMEDERDRLNAKYSDEPPSAHSNRRTSENSEFQAISAPTASKEEMEIIAGQKDAGVMDLRTAANQLKKELGKDKLDTYDMAKLHGLN